MREHTEPELRRAEPPRYLEVLADACIVDTRRRLRDILGKMSAAGGPWRYMRSVTHRRERPRVSNLYFGNPSQGGAIMRERPRMATLLPMVLTLVEAGPGSTHVIFRNPFVGDGTLDTPARRAHNHVVQVLRQLHLPLRPVAADRHLTGRWEVIACQLHGKWLPSAIFREFVFHVSPRRYHLEWSGLSFPGWVNSYPKSFEGAVRWGPGAGAVTMVPDRGKFAGVELRGRYHLDHDIMRIVFGLPAPGTPSAAPTEFRAGQDQVYEVWRRLEPR